MSVRRTLHAHIFGIAAGRVVTYVTFDSSMFKRMCLVSCVASHMNSPESLVLTQNDQL